MSTTIHPLIAATMLCAEYRDQWCREPGNQRPPIHDRDASFAWWQRWLASSTKARCDALLRNALESVSAPTTLPAP